jgi:hypothetical protein
MSLKHHTQREKNMYNSKYILYLKQTAGFACFLSNKKTKQDGRRHGVICYATAVAVNKKE